MLKKKIGVIFTILSLVVSVAGAQESTRIVFWDNIFTQDNDMPQDQQFIFQAIARFEEENPDIEVERVLQSSDISSYYNALRAAGIARNGPDLATLYAGGTLGSFAQFLEPLDNYFSKNDIAQLVGWESVRQDFQTDGAILGAPIGAGSYFGVYYNKELFQSASIDTDNFTPPATWDDLLALAQQLKEAGVTPVAMGEQEGYTGAWIMSALAGSVLGPDGFFKMRAREVPVNDSAWVKSYEAYHQLYADGLTNPDANSRKNEEGQVLFFQGRGAMLVSGGWANQDLYTVMGDNVGVFAIPGLADATFPGAMTGGPNVAVSMMNYSQHKPEAAAFIKFLLRPDTLDLYVKLTQTEPSNSLDADTSVIENPLLQAQADLLAEGRTIYPFDNIMPQEVNDLFYRLNSSVLTGRQTAQEAADELQAEFERSAD